MSAAIGPDDELPPRERARVRHRDQKRSTTMVVDGAAIKRIAQALSRRQAPLADGSRHTIPPPPP